MIFNFGKVSIATNGAYVKCLILPMLIIKHFMHPNADFEGMGTKPLNYLGIGGVWATLTKNKTDV
jgi:hypothetical protein